MYSAIYLERVKGFITGDDIDMTFILMDSNNDLVIDLSAFKIKCEITRNVTEIKLANTLAGGNDTQISVSGSKIVVHMSSTNTTDINEGKYDIELEVEIPAILTGTGIAQINTVFRDIIEFVSEVIDW